VIRAAALAIALITCLGQTAAAKTTRQVPYPYDPVWSALVRFLRVDEKLKLVEGDAETGYVIFELSEGKRTFGGAAELSRTQDATGRAATRVTVRIADRPAYMELGLLDRFELKLREELGEPPPPPPPPAPPAPDKDEAKP
jgi:hypothetical protein